MNIQSITQAEVDGLYHHLRLALLHNSIPTGKLAALISHLSSTTGSYEDLLTFSEWYGRKYLLFQTAAEIIKRWDKLYTIIDVGSGKGWFGASLAECFPGTKLISVDKREWYGVDFCLDLEKPAGLARLTQLIKDNPSSLIVCADLIHCLDRDT